MNPIHAERPLTKWTADHPSERSYRSSSPIKTGVVKEIEKEAAEWVREAVIGIETTEEAALLAVTGTDSEIGVELAQEVSASIVENQVTCK